MMGVFRSFDTNGDGKIDKSELDNVFRDMGKVMPKEHIDRMMELKDKDNSGSLDYAEFIDAVLK